jgi:hypothetical protein
LEIAFLYWEVGLLGGCSGENYKKKRREKRGEKGREKGKKREKGKRRKGEKSKRAPEYGLTNTLSGIIRQATRIP